MRSTFTTLAFRLGVLALAACSRSPLGAAEGEPSQTEAGAGGSLTGSSGGAGGAVVGGAVLVGGSSGGAGGAGVGGVVVGGAVLVGGSGGDATSAGGGQPATGGFPSTAGGAVVGGSLVSGGRGGSVGGAVVGGSLVSGGRGGSVGGAVVGGSLASSGRGGSVGGAVLGGSSAVGGGRGGNLGGAVVGGSLASGGRGGSVGGAIVGGSSGGRGGTGGAVSSGAAGACPTLASNEELIDDLNDGDRYIPRVNGRVGAWSDGDDGTPGGTMVPDPTATFTPTDTGDACRKYAVFVKGTGFTDGGANFAFGLGAPYDASKYTGISFWAKSDSGGQLMRALFPDQDTDPVAGLCKMTGGGSNQCYDHYGKRFTITPGWNKYNIAFKDLSQDGWGRQGTAFDPSTLFEIYFQIPANATFALWMDDIAFTM